jgi:hypothetical protein
VASLVVGGCTSEGEQAPQTYADPDYGFSFTYPADWRQYSSGEADINSGAAPVAMVTVGDPDGARSGDTGLDLIMVRVYQLNTQIDESLLPALSAELEGLVAGMQAQDPSMKVEQPLVQTSVNGLPGFQFTWTFEWDESTPVRSTSYFLFAGDLEYELVVQSSEETWAQNQEVFATLLSTFSPESGQD